MPAVRAGLAVLGHVHAVALLLESLPEEAGRLPVVLHHENTHASILIGVQRHRLAPLVRACCCLNEL